MNSPLTRRHALTFGASALIGGPAALAAEGDAKKDAPAPETATPSGPVKLEKGAVILFQGDSITDAGRDRKREGSPNDTNALGRSYAALIGAQLLAENPSLDLKIYNRGISGNKVPDLEKRWKADCIDIKPNIVSILIGVNDIWHKLNGNYNGTPGDYEAGYASLLKSTQRDLPGVRLVVCQPFVLKCGAVNDRWFPEFTERMAAAERVAKSAGAIWVPFQDAFDKSLTLNPGLQPAYWGADGVHPSAAGHAFMAATWRKAVGI